LSPPLPPPKLDVLQDTLDVMVLQTLAAMGSLHGYGIARRIEQVSGDKVLLNQGTIYASRKAKFYSITKKGRKHLSADVAHWERLTGVMARVLVMQQEGVDR
jgi:PadR family transcriptional regulator